MLSLLLKVPLISDILVFLQPEAVFHTFINASFFVFGNLFIFQNFLPFQYGKTYTKGKSLLRLEIRDRFSVFIVHSSGPIIFIYSYFFFYAKTNLYELDYTYQANENNPYILNHDITNNFQSLENFYNTEQEAEENNKGIKNGYYQSLINNDENIVNSEDNEKNNNEDNNFKYNKKEFINEKLPTINNKPISQPKFINRDKRNDRPFTFKSFMKSFISMPSILYLIHYAHRVFVYPWFRSSHSRAWPLESVLFFSFTNMMSALVLSWSLFFKYRRFPILVQVILSVLFILLMAISSFHDYYLCTLRQPGESGYRIPKGLCFNWVSCPHYTFELAEWFVFGFFIRGNMREKYLFWLIEFLNLSIRARSSTIAYRKMFNLKYPVRRNPILPIFYSPV